MANRKKAGAVVMTAIMIIGIYTLILSNNIDTNVSSDSLSSAPEVMQSSNRDTAAVANPDRTIPLGPLTQSAPVPAVPSFKYNDGSFTIDSTFFTPSGIEQFSVTLSIEDDVISKVASTMVPSSDMSRFFQEERFVPGISGQIVGKDIDTAILQFAVNGATLHSIAFNDSLEKVKREAFRSEHNLAYSGS